jgi:hypothetical protein
MAVASRGFEIGLNVGKGLRPVTEERDEAAKGAVTLANHI